MNFYFLDEDLEHFQHPRCLQYALYHRVTTILTSIANESFERDINGITHYVLFFCRTLFVRVRHLVECSCSSFLKLMCRNVHCTNVSQMYQIVQMYHNVFVHSTIGGHLGCFQFLALMNEAAINILVYVFYGIHALVSLGVELLSHRVGVRFPSAKIITQFYQVVEPIYTAPTPPGNA